jgi:hypothetical protein
MFKINKIDNRISRLESKKLSDIGFREREHLQEWLANEPEALGEELLIIQKEFDGFDDTRERLDLLALDKNGNLVVIENKLDDSGKDVVWQALKYASYCTNLNKSQIIEIYQSYLEKYCKGGDAKGGDAKALLSEFLDGQDLAEVVLNSGNNQRLMFVAASFRKEVTSTALWLLGHGIQLQCIKVTPFSMGEELLLNVEQVIPTPEAKEFMIGMSVKEAEEKQIIQASRKSHRLRLDFWEQALEALSESDCDIFKNRSATKDHWLDAGSGLSGCPYRLIFSGKEVRVELWLGKSDREFNKRAFDALYAQKDTIEASFGAELEWLRLDNKKSSRVQFSYSVDGCNKDNWSIMISWLVDNMIKLEAVFNQRLKNLRSMCDG